MEKLIFKDNDEYLKFLDNLSEFLGNCDGQITEEIIQELKEEGIDYEASFKRFKNFMKENFDVDIVEVLDKIKG